LSTLAPPAGVFTHASPVGNSGAAIVSTGARNRASQPIEPTISS
jgi:hypothetical protein